MFLLKFYMFLEDSVHETFYSTNYFEINRLQDKILINIKESMGSKVSHGEFVGGKGHDKLVISHNGSFIKEITPEGEINAKI